MKRTTPGRPPLDDDDASVPVCVSLPGRQYDAMYTRAQRDGVTVPEVIRRDLERAAGADDLHIQTRPDRTRRR
jgi:hypothetical protein